MKATTLLQLFTGILICIMPIFAISCKNNSTKLKEAQDAIAASNLSEAEKLLTEITDTNDKSPVIATANLELASLHAQNGHPSQAASCLIAAATMGNDSAANMAINFYLEGNERYNFPKSNKEAVKLMEKIQSVNPENNNPELNGKLVELYLFSTETAKPIKALDIISAHRCNNWKEYRHIINYMGAGGQPQNMKEAAKLLDMDPLPETAVYMGHLSMLRLLSDGYFPEQKVMYALKYYNIALRESKFADKQAISQIVSILQNFLNQFNSRTLSRGFYQFNKRRISGGWQEYRNDGFDYCGGVVGSYPGGIGVGSHEDREAYCGNYKNGYHNGLGVKYERDGSIFCGQWDMGNFISGFSISSKGEISYF